MGIITGKEFLSEIKGISKKYSDGYASRKFTDCTFEEFEDIENSLDLTVEVSVNFTNCTFKCDLNLFYWVFEKTVKFKNCVFESDLYFSDCKFNRLLFIESSSIYGKTSFVDSTINQAFISNTTHKDYLSFSNITCNEEISISSYNSNNYIEKLLIDTKNESNYRLSISFQIIKSFSIRGELSKGNISLRNITTNAFEITNFHNRGKFNIYNLNNTNFPLASFCINESNLGDTEFYQTNFKLFDCVSISNSFLLDCIFISTIWKFPIQVVSKNNSIRSNTSDKPDLPIDQIQLQQIETYRQLKLCMSKSGNYLQEREFHIYEMNSYNKTLSWRSSFWTKAILHFSNYCSRYGLSFSRPLLFLIGTNLLLFFILTNYLDYQNFNYDFNENFEKKEVIRWIGEFCKTLNPLRKFDDNLNGLQITIDLLGRIFTSAFLYNIVRATRRFVN